ncbi:Beta-barrel assembly-enhancing protease [Vibrio stylophorae]|uniref:Beta-barrel assembly-enhancing protease n=1 Tax=Vibrio stylophorae TaxID=659351 RepID=A0ABM8ZRK2_9VIBR|nr:type IV pilus biogenesis/stability protein PilW [Vibrio stylophorae]CAH0532863.1 Beta-barrel assembly-enhancing protease [Vibrio stylophorae]
MLRQGRVLLLLSSLLLGACQSTGVDELPGGFDKMSAAENRIKLGLGYIEKGNMQRAYEHLRMAVTYAPDYYRAQLSLAYYYQLVEDNERAEITFNQALRDNPDNGDVLNNYGVFLCKNKDYKRSVDLFLRATQQPYYYQVASSFENAAMCSALDGNQKAAEEYYQRALDYDPKRDTSAFPYAEMLIEQKRYEDARQVLNRFARRSKVTPEVLWLFIRIEYLDNNPEQLEYYGDLLMDHFPESQQFKKYLAHEYR